MAATTTTNPPTDPQPTPCKSCGQLIYFAVSGKTGGMMPVDSEPHPQGNILLTWSRSTQQLTAVVLSAERVEKLDLVELGIPKDKRRNRYRTHFQTCPHADEHRKK